MKVKELIWRDNSTAIGKDKGFIDLRSEDEALDLCFYISNTDHNLRLIDKFKLIIVANNMYYAHDNFYNTIDECKKVSQKVYRKTIIENFFQKQKRIKFPKFWYESNSYFGWVKSLKDFNIALGYQTDPKYGELRTKDDFLDRSKQHYDGSLNFGTRREHTGTKTLREFLIENNINL